MQVERWPRSVSFITERFKFFHAAGRMLSSPLIRLAVRSTPCPQFGIVVFEQINCSNTRCLIEPAPALFCHWQGRYSGSRLGEGFYSCAVFMLLGRSIQHSQTDMNDQCTQPRPRGTLMQSARAGEARPRGKAGSERRKACFHPGGSGFHLPRGWPGPLPV